jgi:hypothetical protein
MSLGKKKDHRLEGVSQWSPVKMDPWEGGMDLLFSTC